MPPTGLDDRMSQTVDLDEAPRSRLHTTGLNVRMPQTADLEEDETATTATGLDAMMPPTVDRDEEETATACHWSGRKDAADR